MFTPQTPLFTPQAPAVNYPTAPGAAAALAPVAGTAMAMHQPQPIEPQRVDPYAQANPYGLPAVQERSYVPLQRGGSVSPSYYSPAQQGPGPAIGFIILGSIALALALVGFIPGAPVFYYAGGGIFGVIGGIRTLIRSRGTGSPLASIAAIVLGSLAIILMVISIAVHVTAYSTPNYTVNNSQSETGTATTPKTNVYAGGLPATPSFGSDVELTLYEQSASNIATGIYSEYAGSNVGTPTTAWPTTISEDTNGDVTTPDGSRAAVIPADEVAKLVLSTDGKSFDIFVSGGARNEIAIYDSESNKFTWLCDTGAASTCPAGGVTPDSGTGGTATTNS